MTELLIDISNALVFSELPSEKVEVSEDLYEDLYEVEKILDKRGRGRMAEYLVKWRNYDDPNENTWEPASNLKEAKEAIKKFNKVRSEVGLLLIDRS